MNLEVCEVCSVDTWIEGNWLLLCALQLLCTASTPLCTAAPASTWSPLRLCSASAPPSAPLQHRLRTRCDGEGCEKAYHTQCLSPPLEAVPAGDWYCPNCDDNVVASTLGAPPCPGPSTDPTSSAHHIKQMAWSTGWYAVNERRDLAAPAESTLQLALEHASSLAERVPEELVNAVQSMCVHAAKRVAFEEALPGEKPKQKQLAAEVEKARLAFEKHQAIVAQHVPAALASSLAEIGAHAARYAARSHLGMDAPLDREAFERAAVEVDRLQGSLPRLWRGTPIPTGPIADELKWMCVRACTWRMASGAWHTARGTRHVAHGSRHVARGTWHVACHVQAWHVPAQPVPRAHTQVLERRVARGQRARRQAGRRGQGAPGPPRARGAARPSDVGGGC